MEVGPGEANIGTAIESIRGVLHAQGVLLERIESRCDKSATHSINNTRNIYHNGWENNAIVVPES